MPKSKFGSLIILATYILVLSVCRVVPKIADNPQISDELTSSVAQSGHKENFIEPTLIPEDAVITEEPVEFYEWCFDKISKKLIQSHVLDALIPSGFSPFYAKSGDLNGDGITDIALVVNSEKTLTRPLLIILGNESGGYTLAKRNDYVILDKESGGIHGDPFHSITIDDGILHICIFGGSSWRWENNVIFQYSRHEGDWFLQKQYHFYYHFEPRVVNSSYLDGSLFEKNRFEDYVGNIDCVTNKSVSLSETPNKDLNYEYMLLNIPNKKIQNKINSQIKKMVKEDLNNLKRKGQFDYSYHANVDYITPKIISLNFGDDIVTFDLKTGSRIRLQDIVDTDELAKMFWKVAQSAREQNYYTSIKEDIVLPEYTVAQLKKAFLASDSIDNNTYSYFYYDGIGISIDREFSAFISYEDLKPILKKDYWSKYILENGFEPTVQEEG